MATKTSNYRVATTTAFLNCFTFPLKASVTTTVFISFPHCKCSYSRANAHIHDFRIANSEERESCSLILNSHLCNKSIATIWLFAKLSHAQAIAIYRDGVAVRISPDLESLI